ncbi:hypothetical protein [Aureispira anguillae]|uniref:Uncharacterized protein n=1 Tax=Aureispira anguillae TaxID=2864201 RepID=A0A916DV16_9BACT|nr:hypothetical protein [Aureispira anguillae]BDS13257.1 hypothetical protein AsAng_0039870 [Aureispira anguillae]
MAKENSPTKKYTLMNALIVGLVCGIIALSIGYLIETERLKHSFDVLFPYAAVGIFISILNFKPLSKLALLLLPPVYALSGFGIVAGPLVMAYLGWEKESMSDAMAMLVENVPFFIISSMLYNWYSSLAGKKKFMVYALFATTTVVVSLLIFGDKYPIWIIQGCYLGIGAFLFSLLHLKQPI